VPGSSGCPLFSWFKVREPRRADGHPKYQREWMTPLKYLANNVSVKSICAALAVSVLAFTAGCGGGGHSTITSGPFVGQTNDGKDYVYVEASPVIDPISPADTSRSITVYATDGKSVFLQTTQSTNGNTFDFNTAGGEVKGIVGPGVIDGTVTMNGVSHAFAIDPARNHAGLYQVHVDLTSKSVSAFESVSGLIGSMNPDGTFPVTVDFFTPPANVIDIENGTITADSTGTQDWIVLGDFAVKGGPMPNNGTGFFTTTP